MQDIESKAAFSQQQLQIVKAQMAAKQRDIRLLQLTAEELNSLPPGTRTYEGVGKMYVIRRGEGLLLWIVSIGLLHHK
jgi:prefoldin subunit 1